MKHSFSTAQSAIDAWIKGECVIGKCRHNIDFRGDVIHSYGRYEIARKLPGRVALINGHRSTPTTERQKSTTRWRLYQAGYTVLPSSCCGPDNNQVCLEHNVNLESFLKQAEEVYTSAITARGSRHWRLSTALSRCEDFHKYIKAITFDVHPRLVEWERELHNRMETPIPEEDRKAALIKMRKATRAENIVKAVEYNARLAVWLNGEGWMHDRNDIPEARVAHVRLAPRGRSPRLMLEFTKWHTGMGMDDALAALYAIRHGMIGTKVGSFTLMEAKPAYIRVCHNTWGGPKPGQKGTKMLMSEINAIADKVGA